MVETKSTPSNEAAEIKIVKKWLGCPLEYLIITTGEIRCDVAQMEVDGTKVSGWGAFADGLLAKRYAK